MDNLIKIQAQQAGFDVGAGAKKVLVDFFVPDGPTIDLSRSYINVNVTAGTTVDADADAVINNMVNFAGMTNNGNAIFTDTACLVKHATARTSKMGKIEDLRSVDTLRSNLAPYKKTFEEADGLALTGLASSSIRQTYKTEPVNELISEGNDSSRRRDHDIRIPLKNVFNFCKSENFDTQKMGNLQLHLEMNFDKLSFGIESINNWKGAGGVGGDGLELFGIAGQEYNKMDGVTLAAGDINTLTSTNEYPNLVDMPYFVGMAVIVERVKDGAAASDSATLRITKIVKDVANQTDKVVLTLSGNWSDGNGAYTAIKVRPDPTVTTNSSINKVELVAYVNNQPQKEDLVYSTYMSQEDSYPALSRITRNYEIPANTKNVYLMFNTDVISGDSDDGGGVNSDNLASYRLTIDNHEVSDRDVVVRSGLHYDLISRVFMNNGESLANIDEKIYNSFATTTRGLRTGKRMYIIACPIPFKPVSQRLGVELNAINGQTLRGKHILYSEVMKKI